MAKEIIKIAKFLHRQWIDVGVAFLGECKDSEKSAEQLNIDLIEHNRPRHDKIMPEPKEPRRENFLETL